ncbi:MAG: surface lipoprotein assembly modifier [Pseudomonadota bacterium]
MRTGAAALILSAFLSLSPDASSGEQTFTLPEARAAAVYAARTGNHRLAYALGQGLLKANPDDVTGLLAIAVSGPKVGQAKAGFDAGKQAYRMADDPDLKFEAAYLTARAATKQEQFAKAQIWLRRAHNAAGNEAQETTVARTFQGLRSITPWSVRLDFSARPSDNINGGARDSSLVINDEEIGGSVFSPDSQALSGLVTTIQGAASYTLDQSPKHRTQLKFRGYRSFNRLSAESRRILEEEDEARVARNQKERNITGSDFDYTFVEVGVAHVRRPKSQWLPDRYELTFGQTWYGSEQLDKLIRFSTGRTIRVGERSRLRLHSRVEKRFSDRDEYDRFGRHISAKVTKALESGARLTYGAEFTRVTSDKNEQQYQQGLLNASYKLAEPIMGVAVTSRLSLSMRDYDNYNFAFIDVEGGRQDQTARLGVSFEMLDMTYYGFRPVISLDAKHTKSNINRFEGSSLGVSFGLRSAF